MVSIAPLNRQSRNRNDGRENRFCEFPGASRYRRQDQQSFASIARVEMRGRAKVYCGRKESRMATTTPADWNRRYLEHDLPWDSGIRSRELARVLDEGLVKPCRAVELGCGTGTNAVFLAQLGFDVTAFDLAPRALEMARARAASADVRVNFLEADLANLGLDLEPFDFIFDRGCYHCVRRMNLQGFLKTLERLSRPGTRYLVLAGNANEQTETEGPPRVTEQEIRDDLGRLFRVERIREFRFEDAGGLEPPLSGARPAVGLGDSLARAGARPRRRSRAALPRRRARLRNGNERGFPGRARV